MHAPNMGDIYLKICMEYYFLKPVCLQKVSPITCAPTIHDINHDVYSAVSWLTVP